MANPELHVNWWGRALSPCCVARTCLKLPQEAGPWPEGGLTWSVVLRHSRHIFVSRGEGLYLGWNHCSQETHSSGNIVSEVRTLCVGHTVSSGVADLLCGKGHPGLQQSTRAGLPLAQEETWPLPGPEG